MAQSRVHSPSLPSPRQPGPPGPPRQQHCTQAIFLFEPTLLASQQQLICQAILGQLFWAQIQLVPS